ncbi:MAG TPA: hypothetical protein VL326_31695 [Kofleriaceae bacterium]|jgi:hypothetical protein|nr:hypothetical protein [Kofleriaceae bacterium]
MGLEYKFVELSIVTDESIEEAVNLWVQRGWILEGIRFVTTEASRRPSMAFVSFTRERIGEVEAPEADQTDKTMPRLKGPRLVKDDDE